MIFQQTFTLQGDVINTDDNYTVIPCSISSLSSYNNYCPTPAQGSEKDRIMEKLRLLSQDLGEINIFAE